ncbi:hypothetical protein [Aestuariivivens marinum]|nr:hypothetical protein [Aestuariivivens marinum]
MNPAVKREKGEFGFVLFFIAKKRTKKSLVLTASAVKKDFEA